MRPTFLHINTEALLHNLSVIQKQAAKSAIIAMVKSNAYGCGLEFIVQALDKKVYAFGVACLAEAIAIQAFGMTTPCLIFQGVHQAQEWAIAAEQGFEVVLHHMAQVDWLLDQALKKPVKIWIKMNTGMNRLGFPLEDLPVLEKKLRACSWVHESIGLMTHFACADTPEHPLNLLQQERWLRISQNWNGPTSACNSAAIWSFPEAHASHVRPGLSLYGVSPFSNCVARDLSLKPVMAYRTALMSIQQLAKGVSIGYGADFLTTRPTLVGMIALGYGDGYPKHIRPGTSVYIKGQKAAIIGRISMDMISIDLSDCSDVSLGDPVELWGDHLAIEHIAYQAGTIPYEIMCQVCPRERLLDLYFSHSARY